MLFLGEPRGDGPRDDAISDLLPGDRLGHDEHVRREHHPQLVDCGAAW